MGAGRTVVFLDGLPHDLFTTQSMLLFKKKVWYGTVCKIMDSTGTTVRTTQTQRPYPT